MNTRTGWSQPPGSWQAPGWAPLVDPGPRPLQVTRSLGRWWWPILAVGGFLAVVVQVLDHEHSPSPSGLSPRGLLTVALAVAVVILLTVHRRYGPGPLARAAAEYTVVALLAGLLATNFVGDDKQPVDAASGQARTQAAAGDDQPPMIRAVTKLLRAGAKVVRAVTGAVRWLLDLWNKADQQATAKGEALATPPPSPSPSPSPSPTVPSIWRFRS